MGFDLVEQIPDPREGRDPHDELIPHGGERVPAGLDVLTRLRAGLHGIVEFTDDAVQCHGVDGDLGELLPQIQLRALDREVLGVPDRRSFDAVVQGPCEEQQRVVAVDEPVVVGFDGALQGLGGARPTSSARVRADTRVTRSAVDSSTALRISCSFRR